VTALEVTDQVDVPVWFPCDKARANRIHAALVAAASAVSESDPSLAFAYRADAYSLTRHRLAVKPIPYRPAPVAAQPVSDTVIKFVEDYSGGIWPYSPATVPTEDV